MTNVNLTNIHSSHTACYIYFSVIHTHYLKTWDTNNASNTAQDNQMQCQ